MDISQKELKMKITKTQEKILTDAKKTIDVLKKYKNHTDFFNNSRNEQTTFTTAYYCNRAYNTAEKYQINNPEQWAKMEKNFNDAVNEQIIFVFAKTESVEALQRAGLIQIIEPAKFKGDAETIKIL